MRKTCIVCGQEFEAKRKDQKLCKPVHELKCPECGVLVKWDRYEPFHCASQGRRHRAGNH